MTKTTVVNIKLHPCDVYVGRGSIWGNPYSHLDLDETKALYKVETREEAIRCYREWFLKQPDLISNLYKLKGKVLGCYCLPLKCHGSVLAELCDSPEFSSIIEEQIKKAEENNAKWMEDFLTNN